MPAGIQEGDRRVGQGVWRFNVDAGIEEGVRSGERACAGAVCGRDLGAGEDSETCWRNGRTRLHAAREAAHRKALRAVVYGGDESPPFHLWHAVLHEAKKEAGRMPALQERLGGW